MIIKLLKLIMINKILLIKLYYKLINKLIQIKNK